MAILLNCGALDECKRPGCVANWVCLGQEKFKQLQARSKVGEKDSAEQGMFVTDAKSTTSPINNMLLLILVTLVCLLAMRVFADVPVSEYALVPAQHQVGDL